MTTTPHELKVLQKWANYGLLHHFLEGLVQNPRESHKVLLVLKAPEYVPNSYQVQEKWVVGDYHDERGFKSWVDRVTFMPIDRRKIIKAEWTDTYVVIDYMGESLTQQFVIPYPALVCSADISNGTSNVESLVRILDEAFHSLTDLNFPINIPDIRMMATILEGLKTWIANPRGL